MGTSAGHWDLVIIGGGGAGMCAALEAEARGQRCLILEADDKLGGATSLSSGVYYAAGTPIQKANGVNDSADAMYEYIMNLNQWALRPEIVRALCNNAADGLAFLMQLGADFPDDHLVGGGRNRVARGHSCSGVGGSIAQVLARAVEAKPIEIEFGVRVDGLIQDEDGRVVGARAGEKEWRAGAVVLTTGGFGNSPEMLKRWFPSVYQHGDRVWAVHEPAPFILGDGITLGETIGAAIVGHDTGVPLPTAGFKHNVEGVLPPWIMLVNKDGKRFMAETSPYSVSGYLINAQRDSTSFAIFDEKTLAEVSDQLDYLDPLKQRMSVPSWHQESIREETAKGVVKSGNTLRELAEQVGINPKTLEASVARYNQDFELGRDHQFEKNSGHHEIKVPPFYAVEVRASMIGLTAAGLDIDASTRVLDEAGEVIPGLYAAGEVLGCVIGSRYSAGGVSIANAITFGRIAGQTATADLQKNEGSLVSAAGRA